MAGHEMNVAAWSSPELTHLHQMFPSHYAFLGAEAVYSMPRWYLDVLCGHVLRPLGGQDEAFERELAAVAPFGFFRGRRLAEADAGLDCWTGVGRTDIPKVLQQTRVTGNCTVSAALREAYLGWLISNKEFRRDLKSLKGKWSGGLRSRLLPRWDGCGPDGDGLPRNAPKACRQAFQDFFGRWGVARLVTWDWPLPMEMMRRDNGASPRGHRGAGLVVTIPWYELRGGIADRLSDLLGRPPQLDHLAGWLTNHPGRNRAGPKKLRCVLQSYRLGYLALRRRYGDRLSRWREVCDTTLQRALLRGKEKSARNIRLIHQSAEPRDQ